MKLFILNDRHVAMPVYRETLDEKIANIPRQSGQWLEVDIPEGKELFVKVWEHGTVMVGTISKLLRESSGEK